LTEVNSCASIASLKFPPLDRTRFWLVNVVCTYLLHVLAGRGGKVGRCWGR
jgi:hypothetical protein